MEFITDRTQADVDRCKVLAAKGWNNMTDSEKAEWYGAAMRGAYNYSDLNRVEAAVAELSEFLELGLTTKTDWGKWENPNASHMSRYISNLQTIKDRYLSSVQIPAAMNSLNYESANNIEKMLVEAYENKDTDTVWRKHAATVKYVKEYTRVDDHPKIGTTGIYYAASYRDGEVPAGRYYSFTKRGGWELTDWAYRPASSVVGMYETRNDGRELIKITSTPVFDGGTIDSPGGTYYYFYHEYVVVGYATYETVPDCSAGASMGCVLIPPGNLPEGTLIEGSLAAGYCYVRADDGNYYYYELR